MLNKSQRNYRKEMKRLQKENPEYFKHQNTYGTGFKKSSNRKITLLHKIGALGGGVIAIRLLLLLCGYVIPFFNPTFLDVFELPQQEDYTSQVYYEEPAEVDPVKVKAIEELETLQEYFYDIMAQDKPNIDSIKEELETLDIQYARNALSTLKSYVTQYEAIAELDDKEQSIYKGGLKLYGDSMFDSLIEDCRNNNLGASVVQGEQGNQRLEFSY